MASAITPRPLATTTGHLIGPAIVAQCHREMGRVGQHDMRLGHGLTHAALHHLALALADRALGLGRAFCFLVLVADCLLGHAQFAEQPDDLDRQIDAGDDHQPAGHDEQDREQQVPPSAPSAPLMSEATRPIEVLDALISI